MPTGKKIERCKRCDNFAKYRIRTPFGEFYVCGLHVKKYKNNIAAVATKLENNNER